MKSNVVDHRCAIGEVMRLETASWSKIVKLVYTACI